MGLIAIGDIHGCRASLDALLDTLDVTPADHLVFIGDYIDRGPDSKGVIDRLIDLQKDVTCTFLRGNHEAFMLDFLSGKPSADVDLWFMNGGLTTLNSYGVRGPDPNQIPDAHVAFLQETKLYLETPDFFFVHAGLRPDLTVAENRDQCGEQVFLWERRHHKAETLPWEKCVVCGHTPVAEPTNRDMLINIDTGCVYEQHPGLGLLTAVRLPERTFVQVSFQG